MIDLARQDVLAIAFAKADQRYTIMYRPATVRLALQQLGRWASEPRLNFDWADARVCVLKLQEQAKEI